MFPSVSSNEQRWYFYLKKKKKNNKRTRKEKSSLEDRSTGSFDRMGNTRGCVIFA